MMELSGKESPSLSGSAGYFWRKFYFWIPARMITARVTTAGMIIARMTTAGMITTRVTTTGVITAGVITAGMITTGVIKVYF